MIHERKPQELMEQIMPRTLEAMICMGCGHMWGALRFVGSDYRLLECPWCKQQHAELLQEAPWFIPTKQ